MKNYTFSFGSGNPSTYTGLAPTFLLFNSLADGTSLARPGITEIFSGSGVYRFQYEPQVDTPIFFLLDGGATITTSSDRYVKGGIDAIQQVDQVLGVTSAAIGSTAIDPSTMFGYVKRLVEWLEGSQVFTKATGTWAVSSRGGTLLGSKTLANNTTQTTRT